MTAPNLHACGLPIALHEPIGEHRIPRYTCEELRRRIAEQNEWIEFGRKSPPAQLLARLRGQAPGGRRSRIPRAHLGGALLVLALIFSASAADPTDTPALSPVAAIVRGQP